MTMASWDDTAPLFKSNYPSFEIDLEQGHHLLLSSLIPSFLCSPIFSLLVGPAALPAGWILPFDILGIQF